MDMNDLLNALNQASGAQGAGGEQPDLGSLLGALGGGAQGGGDPLAGLLGGLLGGGQTGAGPIAGSGSPLEALIRPFAEKLGLSPQMAGMVVTFLMNALLSGKMAGRGGAAAPTGPAGMDLGDAIAGFGGSKPTRSSAAGQSLAQQLSQETGLDEQTAARSIDEFVNLLGGQQGIDRLLGAR